MGAPSFASFSTTTATAISSNSRLRREDFRRTKHDSAFSKWKILIGPTDWENYEARVEGAERYRVANLPEVLEPGLYEIGVAVWQTDSGRDVRKLEPDRVVVVYLGQADNVRSRLQHYGRSGSHLVGNDNYNNKTGLFKDVFSRGYPIVYRWAPMKSKSEAERTETKLLQKFDYAWNKVGNGSRRPNDVLAKIEKIASRNDNIPKILKMLQVLKEQKVGISIQASKPSLTDSKPGDDSNEENFNLFSRVFMFSRSQPRVVSVNPVSIKKEINHMNTCGVTLNDGSTCSNPPVQGRKRCAQHKGKRLANVGTKNSSLRHDQVGSQENLPTNGTCDAFDDHFSPTCGVTQHDGSTCMQPAFPGRKRCLEHKGMRVNRKPQSMVGDSISNNALGLYCGVELGDGKCCKNQPVKGRKRCEEHKGMRVDSYLAKLSSNNRLT